MLEKCTKYYHMGSFSASHPNDILLVPKRTSSQTKLYLVKRTGNISNL